MTLSTNIYIDKFITPKLVMRKLSEIIEFDNYQYTDEPFGGSQSLFGQPGQGAAAWLIVAHNNGMNIELPTEPEEIAYSYMKPHRIKINLDSAYSIAGGSSNVHAYIIQQIAEWKLDTDFTVDFSNEFSGTYHTYDELYTFGDPDMGRKGIEENTNRRKS